MPWNAESVVSARETIARLLEDLQLADYLFGVEPTDGGWEVRVECRCRAGSYATRFGLESRVVQACDHDLRVRRRVRAFLRERLGDCTRTARRAGSGDGRAEAGPDTASVDLSTLAGISEYSSTAGGAQISEPGLLSHRTEPGHPMTHFDAPDPLRRELYWYALEEATQDPHPPEEDLAPAEEAAMHLVEGRPGRRTRAPIVAAYLPVSRVMSRHVETVSPDAPVPEVAELFARLSVEHVAVVDGERLVGLISLRDLSRAGGDAPEPGADLPDTRRTLAARDIMQPRPLAVRSDATIRYVANLLSGGSVHALPVLSDQKRLLGMVTGRELIRFLAG